ncbi:MAG TPA: urate hydroxylase PuuD [Albitalea sp.]
MEGYVLDWANLLLRWAHVIVAIAWIGSSFYFVFLDNSLTPPTDPELKARGVDGELWAVHGGGFYNPQKYVVAPARLPEKLHWFYWESYSTWLTGFALFAAMYLWQADVYLVDPRVHAWGSSFAAGAAALGFLVGFWLIYDLACRTLGQRAGGDRLVGAVVAVLVVASSWLACQLFAGRAAFLLVGAMLATAMSANVAHWIIPGQRKVIAQMKAGEPVDPAHGQRAKQRSVHNTYFTLPVVVAMLSNHYGMLHEARLDWLVLVLLMAAGALIRHSFVARHRARVQGRPAPWGAAIAGCVVLAGVAVALAPAVVPGTRAADAPTFPQVRKVVDDRCVPCHNAQLASKNLRLDVPQLVVQNAARIHLQAVVQKTMPLNNATGMTEAERAVIARWFESGAKGE